MAEINTKINLIDNMSPALKGMHKALNVLLNTFEAVAAKTKTPIDVKAVQTARNELARVGVMLDKVGTEAIQTAQATQNIATATTKVAQVANDVSKTWTLTQHQMARIDKITTEIALSEDSRLRKLAEIAKLRAAEEVDQGKIKTLELEIDNLLAGESLKRESIFKLIDDAAKAAGKLTNESVRQEILANRLAASRAKLANVEAIGAEKLRKAEELTNNVRLHGENIKKRGAALDEAAANRAERKAKAAEKLAQKLAREEAIQKSILATQERYAGAVAKVTQKYEEAKQKVRALEQSADRYTQAGKLELKTAREVCNQRQKILDATNKLVSTRAKLNTLEIQGKSVSLQALIAKRQERSLKEQIAKSSSKIVSIERQLPGLINQATAAQNRHNTSIKQGVSNTSMLWSKMKSLAGAYIGVQTVGGIIKTADALAANEARLNLMVKEGETVKGLSDKIYAAAMRSRTGYLAMADSVAKLGIQAGHLFGNNDQMVRFMETFDKVAVISKSTTQQTNAAMTQLIQALSFGQLRGDELKSILENMPFVAHLIADELERVGYAASDLPKKLRHIAEDGKVTEDEIRAIGYEGELASETVVNAMLNGAKKVDKMAKNMTWTWAQVWEVFKNAALRAFTPIFEGISKIIQTDRFKRFATWVDGAMTRVANAMKGLWDTAGPIIAKIFDGVAAIGNFIGNNWSFIAPVIWGIVWAMTALKIITMAQAIWSGILTAAKIVCTFFTWAFTKATLAETGAQWGLNEALYACPLNWIVIAIIAVIVVIYLVIAAINKCCGTTYSATGLIAGCVLWLGALILNILSWVFNVVVGTVYALAAIIANIFIGIWNIGSGIIQALVNAWQWCCDNIGIIFDNIGIWWTNLWADCYIFFCDFITKVINKLASLAEYVQPIAEVLGMDIAGKLNKIKKGVSDARDGFASQKKEYKSLKAFKDINWKSQAYVDVGESWKNGYDTTGYFDLSNAFDAGYEWGDNVSKKFEAFTKGDSLEDIIKKAEETTKKLEKGDFSNALDGGFDDPETANGTRNVGKNPALNKILKNTNKIADNTENDDDEYFKYLRRAGQRKSMERQQLVNFKVDMSNVIHNKNNDIDWEREMSRAAKILYNKAMSAPKALFDH